MQVKLSPWAKAGLVFFCLVISFLGFMIKLPAVFRHHDRELHAAFYFLAAAFLNLLFVNRNIFKHALVFALLYLFGVSIEFAQEYSNKLLHARIHGRYDPEDVEYNLKGLIAFSAVWIIFTLAVTAWKMMQKETTKEQV